MTYLVRAIEWFGLLLLLLLPTVLLSWSAYQPIISSLYLLSLAAILFYFSKLWQKKKPVGITDNPPKHPILASIIALLAILAVGPIYDAVSSFFGIGNGSDNLVNQQALASLVAAAPILAALHIVVYAPISEEILFRGLFLRLLPRFPIIIMMLSSFTFAALHAMPSSWDFAPYFIMGIIFASLHLYTRQLRHSIIVHAINNLFGYLALWLQT